MNGSPSLSPFSSFVAEQRRLGQLIVQPRMGFSDPALMRRGLEAVRDAGVPAIGTVTLDSYTRTGQHDIAAMAVESGTDLNGYPLVAHGARTTTRVLDGVHGPGFPVQLRHGSARPEDIFAAMLAAGIDASEGGPVSYCLPYSRVPLREATASWSRSAALLAEQADSGVLCHLESFGGCMLGQLCPPGLLVALSVLECLFFVEHGVPSVSASYAQQTNHEQDLEALWALRRLCTEELSTTDHHIVVYTYMGLYPESGSGSDELLVDSVRLAVATGAERLIVKTRAEARRIPTIDENVAALRLAHRTAADATVLSPPAGGGEIYQEARVLIDEVRGLAPSLADALPIAFERGLLDVPFCLHPDNANQARCVLDGHGRLQWWDIGGLPLAPVSGGRRRGRIGVSRLLTELNYHRRRLDRAAVFASNPSSRDSE